jgi:hypothetical protein
MKNTKQPWLYRFYLASFRFWQKGINMLQACFTGFWLGVLPRDILHSVDKLYYDSTDMYHRKEYNRRGLFAWEKKIIDQYFQSGQHLWVGGVGGGREPLGLYRLGFQVNSFECHPQLVEFANTLLREEGFPGCVELAPRDQCPPTQSYFDGLIMGWGAYMLIQGRKKRVAFLKQMRAQVASGAPLMLSFYFQAGQPFRFKVIASIANFWRWLLGREKVDVGDDLEPDFVHHFTEEQIRSEMKEAGFDLVFYTIHPYGHSVGLAV